MPKTQWQDGPGVEGSRTLAGRFRQVTTLQYWLVLYMDEELGHGRVLVSSVQDTDMRTLIQKSHEIEIAAERPTSGSIDADGKGEKSLREPRSVSGPDRSRGFVGSRVGRRSEDRTGYENWGNRKQGRGRGDTNGEEQEGGQRDVEAEEQSHPVEARCEYRSIFVLQEHQHNRCTNGGNNADESGNSLFALVGTFHRRRLFFSWPGSGYTIGVSVGVLSFVRTGVCV